MIEQNKFININNGVPMNGRREFIKRMGLLGSLVMACPASVLAELRSVQSKSGLDQWSVDSNWKTLAAVQEVLLPAGDAVPGANDIAATRYLYNTLENPQADADDKSFIIKGVGWLNELALDQHKKSFIQLSMKQQDTLIHAIVKSRAGHNWVSMLLTYTLEALLTDPVYGGNKNGSGWTWLQHQPGFPAPSADKTWYLLLQRRYGNNTI